MDLEKLLKGAANEKSYQNTIKFTHKTILKFNLITSIITTSVISLVSVPPKCLDVNTVQCILIDKKLSFLSISRQR